MKLYHSRIIEYLMNRPGEYVKIDNIRIDLFIYKSSDAFTRAWQDLIACGRLEARGNEVRINQWKLATIGVLSLEVKVILTKYK